MESLSKLTVVILTYKTNRQILLDCLNSIDINVKVKIIENSNKFEKEEELLNKFSNLSIECTGENLGFGGGNNFAYTKVQTKYVLSLSPDTICSADFFKNIRLYLDEKINFSIIGVSYIDKNEYSTFGYFDKKKNLIEKDFLIEAGWVMGCAMLINLNKFKNIKIFDEKIFIYFDEFDACYNAIRNGGKVFSSKILLIRHLGNKGSLAADPNFKEVTNKFRDWHWMWSQFYFYKKNYSYFFAFKKFFLRLIKFGLLIFVFKILQNKKSLNRVKYRFFGLFNSMVGRDSFYRLED